LRRSNWFFRYEHVRQSLHSEDRIQRRSSSRSPSASNGTSGADYRSRRRTRIALPTTTKVVKLAILDRNDSAFTIATLHQYCAQIEFRVNGSTGTMKDAPWMVRPVAREMERTYDRNGIEAHTAEIPKTGAEGMQF
jgi:hypothetical protein